MAAWLAIPAFSVYNGLNGSISNKKGRNTALGFEFEMKYAASPAKISEIEGIFGGDFERISMETTYYDTESRDLSAHRWSLRRRMENGVSVCNLKIPLDDNHRGEWECEEESIAVGAKILAEQCGNPQLLSLCRLPLVPTCGAKFTRMAKKLRFPDFSVELALDQGILLGGGRTEPLCEIEIEHKDGSMEKSAAFAAEFAEKYGLLPEKRSKFARARALEDSNGI